jgi:hypothetical protein
LVTPAVGGGAYPPPQPGGGSMGWVEWVIDSCKIEFSIFLSFFPKVDSKISENHQKMAKNNQKSFKNAKNPKKFAKIFENPKKFAKNFKKFHLKIASFSVTTPEASCL